MQNQELELRGISDRDGPRPIFSLYLEIAAEGRTADSNWQDEADGILLTNVKPDYSPLLRRR